MNCSDKAFRSDLIRVIVRTLIQGLKQRESDVKKREFGIRK